MPQTEKLDKSWSDADGWTVRIYRQYDTTWISVSMQGRVSQQGGSIFSTAAITPVTFGPYLDGLRKSGKDAADYRQASGVLIRKAAIPFIESVIAELRAEEGNAVEALRRNVPGLAELRAAIADEHRYAEQFSRMMEDENNDGARPPRPVAAESSAIAAKYPVAAAYLKAESWEMAGHDVKATAGKRAKSRIAAGENHEQALADMEAAWSAHIDAHAWD